MYLSILQINTSKAKALLNSYIVPSNYLDLPNTRPSITLRRLCSLALARDLLIKHNILPLEDAKLTTIQHYESGEPYLKFPEGSKRPLQISISHSGLWCACLISNADEPSGIDLESVNIKRNYLRIAEHYFSPIEIERVKEFGAGAFYKLWTAKEAIAKLQGKGLSEALQLKLNNDSLNNNIVNLESGNYCLTRLITHDYICTIARKVMRN